MLLNIALCDDEVEELNKIGGYLTQFSMQSDVEFKISAFSSGRDLINSYNNGVTYNIIFLDVEMPQLSGIETAQKIRNLPDRNVLITFITSFPEYMQDSFDVQASQYLMKPLSYDIFYNKLKKQLAYLNDLQTNIAVISLKNGEVLLHLDDIICFETIKSLTTKSDLLVTTKTEELIIKGKIAQMENQLKDQYFISVHRSVLVNMKYIRRFNANSVELSNGKTVEVSRRKIADVKNAFSKYMVVRYRK